MRIFVKQLKKNYDFDFPVESDILQDEEGITATWEEPLRAVGTLTIIDEESAKIEFDLTGEVVYPCSRCLEPVKTEIDYSFDELIDEVNRGQVDITEYVLDCLYINEPFQILCDPDCKGLCPVCGTNLNTGSCDCSTEFEMEEEIDPRLLKLKEVFAGGNDGSSKEKDIENA